MAIAVTSALAALALAAPAAEAKSAKLDGQLIAAATTKGSKVEAPILLSEKSAKKLKLRSPLATLRTKANKTLQAPNPTGQGTILIEPGTLRSGDELKGKAKVKGKKKALMPKLKVKKLEVTDRESAYSVDELTGALVALYQQVGALGLRVDALESGLTDLRAELEKLKAQNASLETQINSLLTRVTDLQATLDSLTSLVSGLPSAAELEQALTDIADLQNALGTLATDAELQAVEDALQGQIATINGTLGPLVTQVTALQADVNVICGAPLLSTALGVTCP